MYRYQIPVTGEEEKSKCSFFFMCSSSMVENSVVLVKLFYHTTTVVYRSCTNFIGWFSSKCVVILMLIAKPATVQWFHFLSSISNYLSSISNYQFDLDSKISVENFYQKLIRDGSHSTARSIQTLRLLQIQSYDVNPQSR